MLLAVHTIKFDSPSSEFQSVLLARLNHQREDYLRKAEELVHLTQINYPSIRLRSKATVAAVKSTNVERREANKVITNETASKKSRRILHWQLQTLSTPHANGFGIVDRVVI